MTKQEDDEFMRVTKLMGLAVTLVALAVTVNALAYKTAVVTNGLTITVETSASAKLAVASVVGVDPGISTTVTTGKFFLTVADKMQPDSVYTYQEAFQITNNDGTNPITLTCSVTGFDPAVTVTLLDTSNAALCGTSIPAATAQTVRVRVTVADTFAGALGTPVNGSLVLTGTR